MLSVAIPSYNRADKLQRLLESLQMQLQDDSPESNLQIEVWVILDGSTDESINMLKKIAIDFPCRLQWDWQQNAGLAASRNRLIQCINGDRIWFLDDDMTVSKSALLAHRHVSQDRSEIIMGPSLVLGSVGLKQFYDARWNALTETGFATRPDQVSFANTSAPRQFFLQQSFDSSFNRYGFEDYDLAIRMLEKGRVFRFNPEAKVWHHYDRGPYEMLRNIRDEGFNRVKLYEKFPKQAKFALQLDPRLYRQWLNQIGNLRMHRLLWISALTTRTIALTLQRGREPEVHTRTFRLIRFANDLALHSGIAQAGGKT